MGRVQSTHLAATRHGNPINRRIPTNRLNIIGATQCNQTAQRRGKKKVLHTLLREMYANGTDCTL